MILSGSLEIKYITFSWIASNLALSNWYALYPVVKFARSSKLSLTKYPRKNPTKNNTPAINSTRNTLQKLNNFFDLFIGGAVVDTADIDPNRLMLPSSSLLWSMFHERCPCHRSRVAIFCRLVFVLRGPRSGFPKLADHLFSVAGNANAVGCTGLNKSQYALMLTNVA